MFQAEGTESVKVLRQDHDCLVEEARERVWLEQQEQGSVRGAQKEAERERDGRPVVRL